MCTIYSPLVYSWLRKSGIREGDSTDIVQDVFRSVFSGISRFRKEREEDTFRGWLMTITRNEIRQWYRRAGKQLATAEGGSAANARMTELAEWVDSDEECSRIQDDPAAEHELIRRAAELVRQDFKSHTWQAFWLTTVDGRPAADVAEQLDMTTGAVRQAKFRVLLRLREVLG